MDNLFTKLLVKVTPLNFYFFETTKLHESFIWKQLVTSSSINYCVQMLLMMDRIENVGSFSSPNLQ